MGSHNKKKRNKKKIKEVSQKTDVAVTELEDGPNDSSNRKREFEDNDSDVEIAPKRKKKKKPIQPSETSDKKGKKSIRQMKREKFAQRQAEAEAAVKDQLKSQCLSYLSQWKHDKDNWKFMKAKQVWLNKNKFSKVLMPTESWQLLLEYFESAKGNIRNTLLDDANKVIKQMDEWTEKQNTNDDKVSDDEAAQLDKPDEVAYKRARDLIQHLQ